MPEAIDTCNKCGKPQSELPQPLKRCAKCLTGKYCSRDCQKADFKLHKKSCRPPADGVPDSLTNPPQSQIIAHATECINLMVALRRRPGFNKADPYSTPIPILRYLYDFCRTTFHKYWMDLLSPRATAGPFSQLYDNPEEKEREQMAKIAEAEILSQGKYMRDKWPKFNAETYKDALGRNFMSAMVVLDESRQVMFGQRPGQVYDFGEEVKEAARAMRAS